MDGFFKERNKKRRKKEVKNRPLVWDIIEDDISKNKIEMAPRKAARMPTFEL